MPIRSVIIAISGSYPDIAIIFEKFFSKKEFIIYMGIFYPPGEPISL